MGRGKITISDTGIVSVEDVDGEVWMSYSEIEELFDIYDYSCPKGWKVPSGGYVPRMNPWVGFTGRTGDNSVFVSNYKPDGTIDDITDPYPQTNATFPFLYYTKGDLTSGTVAGYSGDATSHPTNGRLYTGTGSKIWFPSTGYRSSSVGSTAQVGNNGYAWNSSAYQDNAHGISFGNSGVRPGNNSARATGHPVRCVKE